MLKWLVVADAINTSMIDIGVCKISCLSEIMFRNDQFQTLTFDTYKCKSYVFM